MKHRRPGCARRWFVLLVSIAAVAAGCSEPRRDDAAAKEPVQEPVEETQVEASANEPSASAKEMKAVEPARREPEAAPRSSPPNPEPDVVEVEVPAGTILELELLTALDSSVSRPGDEIQAKTLAPVYVEGDLVLGAGAYVEGRVTDAEPSGRVKGRSRIAFTFDRLRTPSGTRKIRTSYVEQQAESGKKKDAAVIGGAAGVGAVVGGIIGGKKGAAIGATIGGAGGTGVVLTTKGEEIRLPAGTAVNVRLDEPVVIERH